MKKIIFGLFLVFSSPIFAMNYACNGTQQHPCVVLDTKKNRPEITNFRTAHELANQFRGNARGLEPLWLSGSAAPSAAGWKAINEIVHEFTRDRVKTLVDIDLRQESHGYLNDNAINLTSLHDSINAGKTYDEVLAAETEWLDSLRLHKAISNVLTHNQFKQHEYNEGQTIPVKSVASEQEIVTANDFQYERLTVQDHMRPHDEDVDRFIEIVKNLPSRTWVHIHCRGGDGRTTTFMAMFDMLYNADKASFNDIIRRQAAITPHYDLMQVEHKNAAMRANYQKRLAFLEKFYRYSRTHLKGSGELWSKWSVKH